MGIQRNKAWRWADPECGLATPLPPKVPLGSTVGKYILKSNRIWLWNVNVYFCLLKNWGYVIILLSYLKSVCLHWFGFGLDLIQQVWLFFFTTCLLSKRGTDITLQPYDMIINKQKPPEKTNDWLYSSSQERASIEKLSWLIKFQDNNPLLFVWYFTLINCYAAAYLNFVPNFPLKM